jgi:starch-binding outer membrane protein, SusD/RagB family
MKNLRKIGYVGALCLGMLACTNLDEELPGTFVGQPDIQNFGVGIRNNVNKATPNDGLGGAFSKLLSGTAWHGSYFSISEISSDEAVITQKGGDWFDGGIWLDMHKHQWTPGNDGFNNAWGDIYNGVIQTNILLADAGMTDSKKAQLRTLRGYFFWRLMDLFGRITLPTTPGENAVQGTRLQAFNFIESELWAAIPDLPTGKQEYGRTNQAGAYALLARLYLNAEVYTGTPRLQDAIDAADMVINSGLYSLDPNYAKVFAPDNVENMEHILVAPFDESTGEGMNLAQMTLHYPSQLTYKLQSQPWNGYSTLEEFYNSYDAADDRKANNFIAGPQVDVDGNPILDLAFDKADDDGAEINYTPAINELAPNGSRQAGARLGKFAFKRGQGNNMDNDFPVLRYGEVLLNKAEALARLNGYGDGQAIILVNLLRTRAGVPDLAPFNETTLLAERGRELFQESLRRTDLIRFGQWGAAWWEKPAHSDINKNIFPIPQIQINNSQLSVNKLTQNPGY